jgi:DNA-binding NtrC family response regulator
MKAADNSSEIRVSGSSMATIHSSAARVIETDDHQLERPAGVSEIGLTYVPADENSTLRGILDETESQVILCALQYTGWNRKRAAALLKISYRGLLYKIRRHSITPPTQMAGD